MEEQLKQLSRDVAALSRDLEIVRVPFEEVLGEKLARSARNKLLAPIILLLTIVGGFCTILGFSLKQSFDESLGRLAAKEEQFEQKISDNVEEIEVLKANFQAELEGQKDELRAEGKRQMAEHVKTVTPDLEGMVGDLVETQTASLRQELSTKAAQKLDVVIEQLVTQQRDLVEAKASEVAQKSIADVTNEIQQEIAKKTTDKSSKLGFAYFGRWEGSLRIHSNFESEDVTEVPLPTKGEKFQALHAVNVRGRWVEFLTNRQSWEDVPVSSTLSQGDWIEVVEKRAYDTSRGLQVWVSFIKVED